MKSARLRLCILLISLVATAASPSPRVVLVAGSCVGCRGVRFALGDIHFVTEREGWSNAWYWPPKNGSGLSAFLHTTDGGRHWRRVPFIWQMGAESGPPYSFIDREHGWVEWITPDDGESHLSATADGGRTWSRRTAASATAITFFDRRHGLGVGGGTFRKTEDGGRTWSAKELPVSTSDAMSFAGCDTGVIVGGTPVGNDRTPWDGKLRIVVTHDGGATWTIAGVPDRPYGKAEVLDWIDDSRALTSIAGMNDSGVELLRTVDGGRTWTHHPDESFQGKNRSIDAIAVAPDGRGYLFYTNLETSRHYVAATTDGGATWARDDFSHGVASCQLVGKQVWCSSGMNLIKLDLPSPR